MSKLMEAALEVMNQKMVKEAKKFDSKAIEKAIEIALSMGGNMTGASKKIEKIAKGLSGEQKVKDALRLANESVEVTEAKVTVNVDWMGDVRDPDTSKVLKKYKIKAKEKGGSADLTGDKKDVAKYLQAVHHAGEYKTVQDLIDDGLYSELEESVEVAEAQSGGKEAYAKFFKATLKKFDVKSVAELDDEKKKEFFNYVDKEWEGTNEDD